MTALVEGRAPRYYGGRLAYISAINSPVAPSEELTFLVDGMLGRLARWLRLLGYDALYEDAPARGDEAMAEQAREEGRVLVTRDQGIPPRRGLTMVVLREGSVEGQLVELLKALGAHPDPTRRLTRCTQCNAPLVAVPREEALREAPPRVRELDTPFFRCGRCRKLYWLGTHVEAVFERLAGLGL